MEELVYCCPQCLQVTRAGIVTTIEAMVRSQHRPIFVNCRVCQRINCILVEDALMTASLDAEGKFIPLDRLEATECSDDLRPAAGEQ
jgi:hypothetical protein